MTSSPPTVPANDPRADAQDSQPGHALKGGLGTTPPFGTHAPNAVQKAILSVSRAMPATKLGRSLASPLKNIMTASVSGPLDLVTFGAKTRLYPRGNLTDKRAMITPQLFDPVERAAIASGFHDEFCFIDAGANTGLYSLFVAAANGPHAKIIAVEPQPVIKERLAFNIAANDFTHITHADVALAEGPGTAQLMVRQSNLGSSGFVRGDEVPDTSDVPSARAPDAAVAADCAIVEVPTVSLLDLMDAHDIACADALKIDIEGAEDRVLPPFFNTCPPERLPKMIVMEILSKDWTVDCVAAALALGYTERTRTRRNIVLVRA